MTKHLHLSTRTLIIMASAMVLFIALWFAQLLYFDNLTKKFSVKGLGPVFVGHLSTNLQEAVTRPLILHTPAKDVTLTPDQLNDWIEPYYRVFTGRTEYRLNAREVRDTIDDFATGLDVKASNARFGMTASGSLTEIVPSKQGQKLDIEASEKSIVQALIRNQPEADLVVIAVEPELSLVSLARMGITTRLGQGTSTFTGSPSSRIHNIKVAAEKMNNIMVPAGQTFSFVDHLGEVEASTGYLPELVIKGDKLIKEYGGGVCQVSTTMFRAAIYSGLKIDERQAHSLAVRYYSPIGFDSTVYPGVVDLKFTNDTPGTMLIQSHVEGSRITFDMFGVSDQRITKLDGPYVYQSNPDGSQKTVFSRTITYPPTPDGSGETKKESFYSSYKSPALFTVVKNPLE